MAIEKITCRFLIHRVVIDSKPNFSHRYAISQRDHLYFLGYNYSEVTYFNNYSSVSTKQKRGLRQRGRNKPKKIRQELFQLKNDHFFSEIG